MENPKIAPVLFCIYNRLSYTQDLFNKKKSKTHTIIYNLTDLKTKKIKLNFLSMKNRDLKIF